ncbi:Protein of unknown function [Gryllus bimaculatus]|nr:Protein of unknown function [Gryllus bimaculatus]
MIVQCRRNDGYTSPTVSSVVSETIAVTVAATVVTVSIVAATVADPTGFAIAVCKCTPATVNALRCQSFGTTAPSFRRYCFVAEGTANGMSTDTRGSARREGKVEGTGMEEVEERVLMRRG